MQEANHSEKRPLARFAATSPPACPQPQLFSSWTIDSPQRRKLSLQVLPHRKSAVPVSSASDIDQIDMSCFCSAHNRTHCNKSNHAAMRGVIVTVNVWRKMHMSNATSRLRSSPKSYNWRNNCGQRFPEIVSASRTQMLRLLYALQSPIHSKGELNVHVDYRTQLRGKSLAHASSNIGQLKCQRTSVECKLICFHGSLWKPVEACRSQAGDKGMSLFLRHLVGDSWPPAP
eukprot:6200965-Pleurochrysis_carterae.AAC.1